MNLVELKNLNLSDLKKPFDPARVSWRVGSTTQDKSRGLALAYIDSRDVQDRLDEVCGPEGWQCRYMLLDKTTVCEIGIKVGDEWVWKADGAGETDVEGAKGSLSDSFKRAAVKWGVGRFLYDIESPWVELEPAGRSFKIKASEMAKLQAVLSRSGSPSPLSKAPDAPKPQTPSSGPPKPSDDKAEKAIAWAKKAIITVKAIRTGGEYNAWATPANRDALKRLGEYDKKLQDELANELSRALDRINPVGA